jgi:hypothetical protein
MKHVISFFVLNADVYFWKGMSLGGRREKEGEGGRRREKEGEGGRRREKEGEGGRRREEEGGGGRRKEEEGGRRQEGRGRREEGGGGRREDHTWVLQKSSENKVAPLGGKEEGHSPIGPLLVGIPSNFQNRLDHAHVAVLDGR